MKFDFFSKREKNDNTRIQIPNSKILEGQGGAKASRREYGEEDHEAGSGSRWCRDHHPDRTNKAKTRLSEKLKELDKQLTNLINKRGAVQIYK